jgi:TP901 family phage tail tape measure protein
MTTVGTLNVQLKAVVGNYLRDMKSAATATEGLTGKTRSAGAGMAAMAASAATAAVGIGGLSMAVKSSVQQFAAFESSMTRVAAVTNTLGTNAYNEMGQAARTMAAETEHSAQQVADAMGFLGMAGFSTNKIIEATPAVLQLASSAMIDVARAADIASNIMSGFGLAASDLASANNTLVATFTNSNTSLEMLGSSFQYVGPVAKAAGLEFEEVAAVIGVLGNAGIQASSAGTALRGSISRLIAPSKEQGEIIAKLGLNVTDATGKMVPFRDIVDQLGKSGATTGEMMTLFGDRAGPAMLSLVEQGVGAIDRLRGKIEGAGGAAERVANSQLETLNGQFKIFKSNVSEAAISVGEGLGPALVGLLKIVTALSWALGKAAKAWKNLFNPDDTQSQLDQTVEQVGMAKDQIADLERKQRDLIGDGFARASPEVEKYQRKIDGLKKAIKSMWEKLDWQGGQVSPALQAITGEFDALLGSLTGSESKLAGMRDSLANIAANLKGQASLAVAAREGVISGIEESFRQEIAGVMQALEDDLKAGVSQSKAARDYESSMDSLAMLMRERLASAIQDMAKQGLSTTNAMARAQDAMERLGLSVGLGFGPIRGGTVRPSQTAAPFELVAPSQGFKVLPQSEEMAALERQHREAQRTREKQNKVFEQVTAGIMQGGGVGAVIGGLAGLGGPIAGAIGAAAGGILEETLGRLVDAITGAIKQLAGKGFGDLLETMIQPLLVNVVAGIVAILSTIIAGPLGVITGALVAVAMSLGNALWHLVSQSEAMADVQTVMGSLFDKLVSAMEPFAEALLINTGAAEFMFAALQVLGVAIGHVALFLMNTGLVKSTKEQRDDLAAGISDFAALKFETELANARLGDETEKTTRTLKEFNKEMKNVPTSWKENRARFAAAGGQDRMARRRNLIDSGIPLPTSNRWGGLPAW